MRIYSDLDNVLINPVEDAATGDIISIIPRPDADWFLEQLSKDGEVWLMTAAEKAHADRALDVLGDLVIPHLSGILTAEDLYPAWIQVDMILGVEGLTDQDRADLLAQIPAVAPAGVIFDDWPLRSKLYYVKTAAAGVGPESWIEVEPFSVSSPDKGGLRKAYAEYVRRFKSGAALAGGLAWA